MSGSASKPRDLNKLSDAGAVLDLEVGLREMPALPVELIAGGGPIRVQVRFGNERGRRVAHVGLDGELQLICQRCMQPLRWPVKTQSPVMLIEAESQADGAPDDRETFLAADGRVSVAALAGEELLLAMPIVPLHADIAECGVEAQPIEEPPSGEETARPFADLRALLEQRTKP
ncbi:MAG TPA: YceD family protein [Steroidobacteraceae bacterium]|jgi:uncharacterized protein|nr:YceD family protein [Steroidobacteraceae bacterium]